MLVLGGWAARSCQRGRMWYWRIGSQGRLAWTCTVRETTRPRWISSASGGSTSSVPPPHGHPFGSAFCSENCSFKIALSWLAVCRLLGSNPRAVRQSSMTAVLGRPVAPAPQTKAPICQWFSSGQTAGSMVSTLARVPSRSHCTLRLVVPRSLKD